MSTTNPHSGPSYATCPNCGYHLHQPAPLFNELDLQHRLPAGDASGNWQHPGSNMIAQCPQCGTRVNFQHGSGQQGFMQH